MSKKIDAFITSRPFLTFLYHFIRAYAWTFRLKVENEAPWMAYHRNGDLIDHTAPPVAEDNRHDPHRFIHDGFVKSPDAALRFILRHCGVRR
jgi:hypothetical protein